MSAIDANRPSYCCACGERVTGGQHDCPGHDWRCPVCGEWVQAKHDWCMRRRWDVPDGPVYCPGRKPE